VCDTITR